MREDPAEPEATCLAKSHASFLKIVDPCKGEEQFSTSKEPKVCNHFPLDPKPGALIMKPRTLNPVYPPSSKSVNPQP